MNLNYFFQMHRIEVASFMACICLFTLVFELVRRHEMKEKYSLLWFLTAASLLVLTLKRNWLEVLASTLGIYSPPTALFIVFGFFIILILIHYSLVLSQLISQNQKLSQKLALLEAEVEEKNKEISSHLEVNGTSSLPSSKIDR